MMIGGWGPILRASGLFPSNYVELVDDDAEEDAHAAAPPAPAPVPEPEPAPAAPAAASGGNTATAHFDYEAAEDNGKICPPC